MIDSDRASRIPFKGFLNQRILLGSQVMLITSIRKIGPGHLEEEGIEIYKSINGELELSC